MKNFKYVKISKTKKLRYIDNYYKKKLYIIFLPGFMSDIDGVKPRTFKKYAIKNKLGFLAIEYSGHGKSSGVFTKGNISEWSNDAKKSIKRIVKKNNFILIGSSMGAWISLNQFNYFKKQIKGFVGIGSAPEFLEKLMWKKFPKKVKQEIKEKGVSIIKHGDSKFKQKQYEYPVTYQLIKDGRKNKVLSKKINLKINVTMFHGQKDEVVPVSFSKKVLSVFTKAKKKMVIIKNGDHSLSQKKNLKKILRELDSFRNSGF
jgi:esterase/lipase